MIVLIKLILAHFIGDFLLQPGSWVREKEKLKIRSFKLYLHILVHGVLVFSLLWNLYFWSLALTIALIHGAIDAIKLYAQKENTKPKWFLIDQGLHLLSIFALYIFWFKPHVELVRFLENPVLWLYGTSVLFITLVVSIIIQTLMINWSRAIPNSQDESLIHAGKYIGMLERLLIFTFILTGHWEGVGFLLAAKSIFRFGDLKESKDRKLTEYILIGTLLSFGIAIFTALLVEYIIHWI